MCFCLVLDGSVLSICYPLFVGRGYYYLCTLLSAICLFYIRAEDVVCYCLHCVSAICFTLHSSPPPFVLSGHGSFFSWLFYFVPRCLLSDIHRRPFFSRRLFSFSFFRTTSTPPHILFGILLPALLFPLCGERRFLCLFLTDCLFVLTLSPCCVFCGSVWRASGTWNNIKSKEEIFFSLSAENGINLDVARTSWKLKSPRVCQRTMTCR